MSSTHYTEFTFFWAGPFSQWHRCKFIVDGTAYNCAEQYMMAQKALLFGDKVHHHAIMKAKDPKIQKALGRRVAGFNEDKWNAVARGIVYKGNYAKFTSDEELRKMLLATAGTELVEASPHDTIWGIGLTESHPDAKNRTKWRGKNWLGEVLTNVRDDMMKEAGL